MNWMTCIFQMMHAAYAYYLSKFTEFVDTVNFLYFGTKISSKLWGQFILLYLQSLFLFSSPSSPGKNSTTFPSFMWFTTGWCRSVSGRAWGFFPEATRLFSPSPTRSSTSSCTSTTCSRHWDQSKLSFPPFFDPSFYLPLLLLKFWWVNNAFVPKLRQYPTGSC